VQQHPSSQYAQKQFCILYLPSAITQLERDTHSIHFILTVSGVLGSMKVHENVGFVFVVVYYECFHDNRICYDKTVTAVLTFKDAVSHNLRHFLKMYF